MLPLRVDAPHVHDAVEPEERARRGARDAVLSRAGLRDDAPLPHPLREERLADGAVDLVRARVREVLALEEHAAQADGLREARRVRERRRAADPVAQNTVELTLERGVSAGLVPRGLEVGDGRHERLGEVLPAELAVPAGADRGLHAWTVRRIEASAWMSGAGSSARMSAVPTSTASTRDGRRRASSTEVIPDSATRNCSGRANACS